MESSNSSISPQSDRMSYLKTAWRSIKNNKAFTVINIIGLTVGLCACMTIYTVTSYEFSFDTFHPDADRIYRVGGRLWEHDHYFYGQGVVPPVAPAIYKEIPGIEASARYYPYTESDTNAIITDGDYFKIFPYHWLAGNPATALAAPFSVVLTESQAHKYFGHPPYIGRKINYQDSLTVFVSGIIADWNKNTDFPYTDLISLSSIAASPTLSRRFHPDSWVVPPSVNPWTRTFIKLSPHTDPKQISALLPSFVHRHLAPDPFLRLIQYTMVLQPLDDIHFNADFSHDGERTANRPVLYGLTAAAAFILLLAIVNFINGSTAQSLRRAKDIGIRRILGSSRWRLTLQFLTETVLVTVMAALLAAMLVYPVIHLFHTYLPEDLHPFDGPVLLFLLAVTALTILLAGLYPARVLSKPVLKTRRYNVRKALIVFQFTISLAFIIGSIVFSKQLHFMLNADPGFARDGVIIINNFGAESKEMVLFANKAQQLPGIKDLTSQGHAPAGSAHIEISIRLENKKDKEAMVFLQAADNNFLPFYRIPLLAGRNLQGNDSMREVVINDTYRQALGFKTPDAAIGNLVTWQDQSLPIVGVIADFHSGSFHDPIYPLVISHLPYLRRSFAFRFTPGADIAATLKQLAATWKNIFPGKTFEYHFLDETIARLYATEKQFSCRIDRHRPADRYSHRRL